MGPSMTEIEIPLQCTYLQNGARREPFTPSPRLRPRPGKLADAERRRQEDGPVGISTAGGSKKLSSSLPFTSTSGPGPINVISYLRFLNTLELTDVIYCSSRWML